MNWILCTAILCSYGFFKEFRPAEPFLTPYLVSSPKNFTDDEVYSEIYPVWTYSYLAALVPVFLLTDLLRYKPVLLWESAAYSATWALLLWGTSVLSMQFMQFAYGWATATEVAYYAYIYAAVDKTHYQKVTSYVRGATQGGKCIAYAISQAIVSTAIGNYFTLNYISFASMLLTFLIALTLPGIGWRNSELLKSTLRSNQGGFRTMEHVTYLDFVKLYFSRLWRSFRSIYSSGFFLKWSIWWALATCGFYQVGNYSQTLWELLQDNSSGGHNVYNGIVEAINTFLGAVTVLSMQFVHVRWETWGEMVLAGVCLVDCALLVVVSQTKYLAVMYVLYIVYRVLYQMMITIAQYNLARKLESESFGLVFGFNTFIALVLQTILTIAVADHRGLHLHIRTQFVVYGCYHGVIGVEFFMMGCITLKRWYGGSRRTLPIEKRTVG